MGVWDYVLYIVILVNIYVIMAVSLNLILGFTGLFSVAHAAFMAIGAYTTTLLMMQQRWNFFLTIPVAVLIAGMVALLLAIPSLRVHGDYYVISSFGFQIIIVSILLNWVDLTHGPYGLFGIPRPTLFGFAFTSNVAYLALATVMMLVCVVISWRIAASPAGQVLRAVREDEVAAAAVGKDVARVKVTIFVVGSALAAVGGSLYATTITFIDPFSFSAHESIFMLATVAIGGSGNIAGSMVGALILIALPEVLKYLQVPAAIAGPVRQMLYGVLLIVFMRVRPLGLVPERSSTRAPARPHPAVPSAALGASALASGEKDG